MTSGRSCRLARRTTTPPRLLKVTLHPASDDCSSDDRGDTRFGLGRPLTRGSTSKPSRDPAYTLRGEGLPSLRNRESRARPLLPVVRDPLADTAPTRGEERKVVSVLFADLVGFTASADRADPEEVLATLRPYHALLRTEIERYGGTVEKFIGDAVMAVFEPRSPTRTTPSVRCEPVCASPKPWPS